MAVTRANVEYILVARVGALMTKASLDGTTVDGSNTDLADPIAWALQTAGYDVADITNPDTAEVALALDDILEVSALAELRTLENILGNLDDVDTSVGPRDEKLSQLAEQVQRRLDWFSERVEQLWGHGAAPLTTGTLTYEFAEHNG